MPSWKCICQCIGECIGKCISQHNGQCIGQGIGQCIRKCWSLGQEEDRMKKDWMRSSQASQIANFINIGNHHKEQQMLIL